MSNFNQAQAIQEELEEQDGAGEQYGTSGGNDQEKTWLDLASEAHRTATTYYDFSLKKQWERNMSHFHSRHASGSKYYTDAYKHRSKFFKPKTRSMLRRHEAAAAIAYFATSDAVNIMPEVEGDKRQMLSAAISRELLNYRLDKSIKWFQTLVGAYQEAMNIGSVVSYQSWTYREISIPTGKKEVDDYGKPLIIDGQPVERIERRVIEDRPNVDLRPSENILIDKGADWRDPVNTSPYLIDMIPMRVYEVKERMKNSVDNEKPWKQLTEQQILSGNGGSKQEYDGLRREREGRTRQDSKENDFTGINDFQFVWVHRNFIKRGGQDWVFYTLGTQHMLSEPVTVQEFCRRKNRPYVMGIAVIEAHRVHPSGPAELGEQTQFEINDVTNTRMDNVRLALNKRHFIRRGANVDYRALVRSAPGSGVLMDDVNDVKQEDIRDVTSSAYAEQDRLNLDFDEVTGNFSSSSVQSNRRLNETVGGMNLLSDDSNNVSEYQLRTFNETWVEPVLYQVLDLIRDNETDENVIRLAGTRAKLNKIDPELKAEQITWRDFQASVDLKVGVGFGATNPQKRIERISLGMATIGKYFPDMVMMADREQFASEVFGALGFEDGKRFFPMLDDENENNALVQQLQQQVQKLQQIIQSKQVEKQMDIEGKLKVEQMKQQGLSQREAAKIELQKVLENIKYNLEHIKLRLDAEKNELARSELLLEQEALIHQQRVTEIQLLQQERGDMRDSIQQASIAQNGMDDSKAGVISRNRYGNVPFAEG